MRKVILFLTVIAMVLIPLTLAVTFEQFPPILTKNGQFNTVIVVGEEGGAKDSLAAINLINTLQKYFEDIEETARKKLEEEINRFEQEEIYRISGLQIDECIGAEYEVVTESVLPKLLSGGTIRTQIDSSDYDQYLRFGDGTGDLGCAKVIFGTDDEDNIDNFLFIEDEDILFELEITFSPGLASDIDGRFLEDIIDEEINILGRTYSFADARLNGNEVRLTLVQGDLEESLPEGATKTFNVGGLPYQISVLSISDGDRTVRFRINGQTTDPLEEGETEILSDGTLIGVRNVITNEAGEVYRGSSSSDTYDTSDVDSSQYEGLSPAELEAILGEDVPLSSGDDIYAGGSDVVQFFIGAHVLQLEDNANDENFEKGVKVNFDSVSNGLVQIKGGEIDGEYQIYSIKYRLEAESKDSDDIYVPFKKGMREFLRNPGDLLSPVWDIRYEGLGSGGGQQGSVIRFDPTSSDRAYNLVFTNTRGNEIRVPFVNNENGFKLGDDDEDFFFVECDNDADFCMTQDAYLVFTDKNTDRGVTTILQYRDIDTTSKQIIFYNLATGGQTTRPYTGDEGSGANAQINAGGNSYTVFIGPGSGDNPISADLNSDGDVANDEVNIIVRGGGVLDIGDDNDPGGDFSVSLTTDASEIEDATSDEVITWDMENRGGGKLGISLLDQPDLELESDAGHDIGTTDYGVKFDLDDDDVGERLIITYPGSQSEAIVSILASEALAPGNLSEDSLFTFNGIQIGTFALDADITDINDQNLLVIGGPCANNVAKELLGNYEPCTAGFEEGKAILRIFNLQNSFAILVAGFSSEDTAKAATILQNFKDHAFLTDTFLEISGSVDNPTFRQLTAREWQDRVEADKYEEYKRQDTSQDTTQSENKTQDQSGDTNQTQETTSANPEDLVEEQGTLEDLGLRTDQGGYDFRQTQNIMIIVGIAIFIIVIALLAYYSFRHKKEEEHEERQKHPRHEVAGLDFKNVPKSLQEDDYDDDDDDDEDDDEEKEERDKEKKKAHTKESDHQTSHKSHKSHKNVAAAGALKKQKKKQEKQRKVEEEKAAKKAKKQAKKAIKKEKQSKRREELKEEPEDVEELDFSALHKELEEGVRKHKRGK